MDINELHALTKLVWQVGSERRTQRLVQLLQNVNTKIWNKIEVLLSVKLKWYYIHSECIHRGLLIRVTNNV